VINGSDQTRLISVSSAHEPAIRGCKECTRPPQKAFATTRSKARLEAEDVASAPGVAMIDSEDIEPVLLEDSSGGTATTPPLTHGQDAENGVPNDSRHLVKPLREERLRLEQPSVASCGNRIGRLVPAPLRGGYPLEWRWGARTSHRTREDRACRLEEGASTPASRRWSRGGASSSRATDWAARRGRRQAREWRGHARGRLWGRKLAVSAPGCLLGWTVRGVQEGTFET
jgi:hypothetical protein